MKKIIKFFLICFVVIGFALSLSTPSNVEAVLCELPPDGTPPPAECNDLP